ncbi:MAG TPA: alpha-amylase/4-alpha-glucanotransferase domain-containing protein [Gemmatimonadales bacterium]|nr:alpha-amylase/4-alpha-glucanotransferase domain-containing protein [Gemmatimonadales bacterium]
MRPLRFVFGLHLHQPVGNFDQVFQQHLDDVYRPLLERLAGADFFPAVLHISGPLLEWLERHAPAYLDRLAPFVADRRIELLLGGFYEPVLASLPRADRVEQIGWLKDALRRRFGVEAEGLWLTERVWEPELAVDLAEAGVRYALVDDRHFLVTGFTSDQLHAPWWTETSGRRVALFPIDERLRYLIPFRPPAETAAYLDELRAAGHQLAVLADDGEKFGGWPGTREWVYDRGWLDQFMATIRGRIDAGAVELSTLADALREVPSGGLAYLPTASYREMEAWSLPAAAAIRLGRLERDLGEERIAGPDGSLIRGAHWRNFFVKYSESNRMHKKMQALSELARRRGDPEDVRRAIGRAQCNDAYWHGVFGGLYLPHLREAIWRNLAAAEAGLRRGQGLAWEVLDLDNDGHDEIWVHSDRFSAVVSPHRGGAVEDYTIFATGINYANALTRRLEPYYVTAIEEQARAEHGDSAGAASIHDIEAGLRLDAQPPTDREDRTLFVDRVLAPGIALENYVAGDYAPVRSWARVPAAYEVSRPRGAVEIRCTLPAGGISDAVSDGAPRPLEKLIRFTPDGRVTVSYAWDPAMAAPDDLFAPELSLFRPLDAAFEPKPEVWSFPIETLAKSERGLDRTLQGESITPRWPVSAGAARISLSAED